MSGGTIHPLTRIGMWVAVVAGAVWVGDHVIQAIVDYTPFAVGLGILLMVVGMVLRYRQKSAAAPGSSDPDGASGGP